MYTYTPNSGLLRLQILLAALISCCLVLALYLGYLFEVHSDLFKLVSLGLENNFASWFSGALLLMIGLYALDGRTLCQAKAPKLARAWTVLGGIFIFLSADEVASLHERLAILGERWELGTWALLLPLGAVIAGFMFWALAQLWRAGGVTRRQTLLMLVGFGLFGSVVIQEFIEHAFTWDTAHARALRASIEEGGELLGMVVLLSAVAGNTRQLLTNRQGKGAFGTLVMRHGTLAVVALLAAPIVAAVTATLGDTFRGRPADWMAAAAFLVAAAIAFGGWMQGTQTRSPLKIIIAVLVLSCACVAISPEPMIDAGVLVISQKALVLYVLTCAVFLLLARLKLTKMPLVELLLFSAACLAFLLFSAMSFAAYGLQIVLGIWMFRTVAVGYGWQATQAEVHSASQIPVK